jgi:hypothetical protein
MGQRRISGASLKSRCRRNQGLGPYHRIEMTAPPASEQDRVNTRVERNVQWAINQEARQADRVRRREEKHLDWDAIREMLDAGMTLAQAKLEAGY